MVDLIYPEIAAPLCDGASKSRSVEMLPVVDIYGSVIRQAPRSFCHSHPEILHPVVHLFLLDWKGRVYLQMRSFEKDVYPLCWDMSAGGHISYGETVMEALAREVEEELGLTDYNPVFLGTSVRESTEESELSYVFAAVGDFKPVPDDAEIEETKWWTDDEIASSKGPFTPVFLSEYSTFKDKLKSLL